VNTTRRTRNELPQYDYVCYDCDDDDDAVSRLRCWVSSQSATPSFDEGEWRRRRQVRRAYAKRGVARSNRTLSPRRSHSTSLTQYDAAR
jgi:hypothetical protein